MIPGVRYTPDPLCDHVTPLHPFLFLFSFYTLLLALGILYGTRVLFGLEDIGMAGRWMHVWRFVYSHGTLAGSISGEGAKPFVPLDWARG